MRVYDSVRREVLYNILIEFWLIKMCLNKTRRCFKTNVFQVYFRTYQKEGSGKSGGTKIKWNILVAGLC
jgi:hypothetical protein